MNILLKTCFLFLSIFILNQGYFFISNQSNSPEKKQSIITKEDLQGQWVYHTLKFYRVKKDYEVEIGYIPSEIENLHVFLLLLPQSKGKVYFHNINLTVWE